MVGTEAFKHLVKTLDPRYDMPSRTHFTDKVIPAMKEETVSQVKNQLISLETSIALTTDGWTSRATHDYVTVTAHLINADWVLKSYCLQTHPLAADSHTGESLASDLLECISEWGIEKMLPVPITTDNASNVKSACNKLPTSNLHVPCFAHTVNLAAVKGFQVEPCAELLAKIRKTVGYFHRSPKATKVLADKQKLFNLKELKLVQDCPTRWNSSRDMLVRYLQQKVAIYAALNCTELKSRKQHDIHSLSDSEIQLAEKLIDIYQPLQAVTTFMSDSQHPTLSLLLPSKHELLRKLEEQEDDTDVVAAVKQAIRDNLQTR